MKELIKTPSVQKKRLSKKYWQPQLFLKTIKKSVLKYKYEQRNSDKIVYKEYNQGQKWLLPPSLDLLIPQDHYDGNKFKQKSGNTRQTKYFTQKNTMNL